MNKKILTVAVATVLAAPVAALADVIVYGQLGTSLDYISSKSTPFSYVGVTDGTSKNIDGSPKTISQRKSNLNVSSNSSRLGFRGAEGLGSGLKAIWQIESEINLTDSSSTGNISRGIGQSNLAGRNSYLGLEGVFGTILTGRHDTPFKMLGRSLDPFGDTVADTRQLLGVSVGAGGTNDESAFDLRPDNVIAYITPNMSGFSAVVAYVNGFGVKGLQNGGGDQKMAATSDGNGGNGGQDNNRINAWSLNVTYSNGPIYAGAAYERHNVKNMITGMTDNVTGITPILGDNQSAYRVGGSYVYGPGKVGAMFESMNFGNGTATSLNETKRTGWTMFGTYGVTPSDDIKVAYTQAGKIKVGGKDQADSSANLLALGLDHNFSKRTKAYVQYTRLANDDAKAATNTTPATNGVDYSLCGAGCGAGSGTVVEAGKDPTAISVGLVHKF